MIEVKVKIPNGLIVPTPEGDVVFPPNEWVVFKPKWARWDLEEIAANGKAMGIQILDQNEDLIDLALAEDEASAKRSIQKMLAYMLKFAG